MPTSYDARGRVVVEERALLAHFRARLKAWPIHQQKMRVQRREEQQAMTTNPHGWECDVSEDARVLCEWIDRTLGLPVYQNVARDSYAEGVVDTLRTVRKLVSRPSDRGTS